MPLTSRERIGANRLVRRLQEISDDASARIAARAFRTWAIAEGLLTEEKRGILEPRARSGVGSGWKRGIHHARALQALGFGKRLGHPAARTSP
jgi:hypothetical protein